MIPFFFYINIKFIINKFILLRKNSTQLTEEIGEDNPSYLNLRNFFLNKVMYIYIYIADNRSAGFFYRHLLLR